MPIVLSVLPPTLNFSNPQHTLYKTMATNKAPPITPAPALSLYAAPVGTWIGVAVGFGTGTMDEANEDPAAAVVATFVAGGDVVPVAVVSVQNQEVSIFPMKCFGRRGMRCLHIQDVFIALDHDTIFSGKRKSARLGSMFTYQLL